MSKTIFEDGSKNPTSRAKKILSSKKTERVLIVLIVLTLVFSIALGMLQDSETGNEADMELATYPQLSILVDDLVYEVIVADTFERRVTGLSNSTELPRGIDGLLFDFNEPGFHGIWMKEMNYNIDILWLNRIGDDPLNNSFETVHVEENVSPETFPRVFNTPTPARFVFEIPVE